MIIDGAGRLAKGPALLLIMGAALMVSVVSITNGAYPLTAGDILGVLIGDLNDEVARMVLFDVRLPRLVLGFLVGAVLAVCGAILQGLFRNPLADPGLIGVSAGASLAAIAVIVLGGTWLGGWLDLAGAWALPIAAFIGGSGTVFFGLAYREQSRAHVGSHFATCGHSH